MKKTTAKKHAVKSTAKVAPEAARRRLPRCRRSPWIRACEEEAKKTPQVHEKSSRKG